MSQQTAGDGGAPQHQAIDEQALGHATAQPPVSGGTVVAGPSAGPQALSRTSAAAERQAASRLHAQEKHVDEEQQLDHTAATSQPTACIVEQDAPEQHWYLLHQVDDSTRTQALLAVEAALGGSRPPAELRDVVARQIMADRAIAMRIGQIVTSVLDDIRTIENPRAVLGDAVLLGLLGLGEGDLKTADQVKARAAAVDVAGSFPGWAVRVQGSRDPLRLGIPELDVLGRTLQLADNKVAVERLLLSRFEVTSVVSPWVWTHLHNYGNAKLLNKKVALVLTTGVQYKWVEVKRGPRPGQEWEQVLPLEHFRHQEAAARQAAAAARQAQR